MKIKAITCLQYLLALMLIGFGFGAEAGAETPGAKNDTKTTIAGPEKGGVGGPFTLVDHNGRTVTNRDFYGNYLLIYFGYTYCPDVCPTSLIMMTDAMERLGEGEEKITPILITIDPERDSPEHLKAYVPHFHPRLVGLSGTLDQIAAVNKAYKVYSEKVFEEGWGVEEYFVYHSDAVYFMGPDGKYLDHFGSGTTPKIMATRMRTAMGK